MSEFLRAVRALTLGLAVIAAATSAAIAAIDHAQGLDHVTHDGPPAYMEPVQ